MQSISRKTFLKRSSGAVLFNTFFKPLHGLLGQSQKRLTLPTWTELVEHARWCPTVHNLQPHKVKVLSDTEAEVYYDPSRLLPIGDPDSIFATVAMGIFIEHLSISAAHYGATVETIKVFDAITTEAYGLTLIARLKLRPSTKKEFLGIDLIKKRRTARSKYDGRPLSQSCLDILKAETEVFGHEFYSSSEKDFLDFMIDLNQETLFKDLQSKPNCQELDGLFRYSLADASSKKDGLWAKCMGFSTVVILWLWKRYMKSSMN